MSDHPTMEARWVELTPRADGDGGFFRVGGKIFAESKEFTITRITVQQDLPALYCNMHRVCIWVGDHLAVEAPMHAVEAVGYPLPDQGESP